MPRKITAKYKRLVGNIGAFTIASGASKFAPFILVPILTRYLNAEEYGQTDLFTTLLNLAVPVLTLSVGNGVLRFCIDPDEDQEGYLNASILLTISSCIFAVMLMPLLGLPALGGLDEHSILVLLSFAVVSLSSLMSNIARAFCDNGSVVMASCASSIVSLVSIPWFIIGMDVGVKGFYLGYFLSNLISCCVYLFYGKQRSLFFKRRWKCSFDYIRKLLVYSIPLVPNSLFWWITNSINRLFLISTLGLAASGVFAAASKLPSLLNMVSGVFQQAWTLSAFQEHEKDGAGRFNATVYIAYSSLLMIVAATLAIVSRPISHLVLGSHFASAWVFIPILLVSFYSGAMASFVGTVYTSVKKTGKLLFTTAFGAAMCLILTWVLVRPLGIQGVCIASAASNSAMCILRIIDVNRSGEYHFSLSNYFCCLTVLSLISVSVLTRAELLGAVLVLLVAASRIKRLKRTANGAI